MAFPDYENSILALPNGVLARFGAPAHGPTLPALDAALRRHEKILWVILDGLGSAALRRALPEAAFLRRNARVTVSSVFPPTTAAATASYYSGLPPVRHGWLGWHMFFEEYGADLTTFTGVDYYSGKRVLNGSPAARALPYVTLFEQLRAAGAQVKTHALCPFPAFFESGADEARHISSFEQGLKRLEAVAAGRGPALALMYWTQPDAAMHERGVDSPRARDVMRDLNAALERLEARLGDAMLLVCSDHGLTDAPEIVELTDFPEAMDMLRRPPSLDRRCSAMFLKPGRQADFEEWFAEHLAGDFLWIPRREIYERRLFGPGTPHPRFEEFIGDGLVVAAGRRILDCTPKGMPARRKLIGQHAGLTESEMLTDVIWREGN